ncbi:MAG: hypothetical protein JW751_14095 [Polyangiaceae bacterium]|nr:hypothetical protein [Polyangiaceae bacterium]
MTRPPRHPWLDQSDARPPSPGSDGPDPLAGDPLAVALRAAWGPAPLDPLVQEAAIASALADPFAPPTEAELAASTALGNALDRQRMGENLEGSAPLELAAAMRAAFAPTLPPAAAIEGAVAAALRTTAPARPRTAPPPGAGRGGVVVIAFGAAAGTLALAAAVALWLILPGEAPRRTLPHASRSAAGLFPDRFELGRTTERIDRIAEARERELRENRYAAWGVR